MIQIIAGKKGSGKTKRLIDMTNNAVKTSSGNVVFLDKNDSYMYEVDRAVRFVNVEEASSAVCSPATTTSRPSSSTRSSS